MSDAPGTTSNAFEDLPEESRVLAPRWLLNGFPKSGLHYVTNLLRPVASPMPAGQLHENEWVGTFRGQSWTVEPTSLRLTCYRIARTEPAHYLKGHLGHSEELAQFTWLAGTAHVFIYRDLRDVAVSQAHHVLSDDDRLMHPDKDAYRSLYAAGGIERVIGAVITGHNGWPGLLQRWQLYAGWMDVPWVFKLRYEALRSNTADVAGELLRYGVERVANVIGFEVSDIGPAFDDARNSMADAAADTAHSATFRRGESGTWQEVFTPSLSETFKRCDTEGWLQRLGYVENDNW